MMYNIINRKSGEVWESFYSLTEARECFEYGQVSDDEFDIITTTPCRSCGEDSDERFDYHGISTGHWCQSCYDSSKYPYKKDRYATIEYDGYGERLEDNY